MVVSILLLEPVKSVILSKEVPYAAFKYSTGPGGVDVHSFLL